ncbi:MAG TPA: tryptophan 7-halogenase, partial [Sphingomonas sp.]
MDVRSPKQRIRTVAVAGHGVAAWSAAAAFAKRVPTVTVAVVPVPGSASSMADVLGGTVPSVRDFHRDIGVDERHLMASTGGSFRLGCQFADWTGPGSSYVHAFGKHGFEMGAAGFHHHWLHTLRGGEVPPFDVFSPAAMLGRHGRFLPAELLGDPRMSTYSHALQLDPARYRDYLHAYARHLGVVTTAEGLTQAVPGERGVAGLRLAD